MQVPARIDLLAIPEDQRDAIAALLRENADLKGETSSLKEIVKRLEHLVAESNHVVHGKKSEKLSEDDRQLAFEDFEAAVAEVEEQHDSRASPDDAPRRKLPPGPAQPRQPTRGPAPDRASDRTRQSDVPMRLRTDAQDRRG